MDIFKHFFTGEKSNQASSLTELETSAISWSDPKKRLDEINLVSETAKRGAGSMGPRMIICALILIGLASSVGYGLFLKQELLTKEQYLAELRAAGAADGAAAGSASDRDIAVIEARAKLLADIGQERDRWSKSLLIINPFLSSECYLTEIKETETGVSLRGACQSYTDLAHFLAFIEKQRLFSRAEILSSGFQPGETEINFEIYGHWPQVKAKSE